MAWELSITFSIFAVATIFAIFSQTLHDDERNATNRPIKFLLFFLALLFLMIGLHSNFPILRANNSTMMIGEQESLEQHINIAYYITGIMFVLILLYYFMVFVFSVIKRTGKFGWGKDDDDENED
jgi:cytochrome bd-type quinol oxidase subunit 2